MHLYTFPHIYSIIVKLQNKRFTFKQRGTQEVIRIAIVEDEKLYVKQLLDYLEQYQQDENETVDIKVYRDGDGITEKYKAQFDIILMDIEMKFVDGMTAAEEIRKVDSEVVIIFITNMPQYAIRGYEVDALDYILKPVSYFSFRQKLNRAVLKLRRRSSKYITVPVKGGMQRMAAADIYYIESEGHNLIFHTKEGPVVTSGTMKSVEEILKDLHFSRGNKCYLINLEHVDGVKDKSAVIKGEKLALSRSGLKSLMQDLTRYWGEVK